MKVLKFFSFGLSYKQIVSCEQVAFGNLRSCSGTSEQSFVSIRNDSLYNQPTTDMIPVLLFLSLPLITFGRPLVMLKIYFISKMAKLRFSKLFVKLKLFTYVRDIFIMAYICNFRDISDKLQTEQNMSRIGTWWNRLVFIGECLWSR